MKTWPLLWMVVAAAAQPAFDVASVKPGGPVRPDGLLEINLGTVQHGVVTLTNTTLSECLRWAYGLTNEEQIAGPDWITSRQYRFEIVAKAPPDTPVKELRIMMQNLLAERFKLALHREPRKIAHYVLTVARRGPRLSESTGDAPPARVYYGTGRLAYTHLTMDRFVVLLSRQMKQPVFDKTRLTGAYDIELQWTPDDAPAAADAPSAPSPDIFSALKQQLGLQLESSKEPLEVLVVDHAEKTPVAN